MAYKVLEVTLLSAKDLKRVNLISRMEVYAVVTISGDPLTRQCTQPDPYRGRHPSWNTSFRFNVPPTAATATGCLHVLLRTERALGDRDVGEVIVPLADILAGGGAACDPGARPPQLASYQVRKVHRYEPRGMLNVSYRLGPIVAPQAPPETAAAPFVGYPVSQPSFYGPPYAYLPAAASLSLSLPPPPHPLAAGGHDAVHRSPQSAGAISTYNSPSAYPQAAAAGHASLPPSPHPQAAGGHDAVHPSPQSAGAISTYNLPAAYPQAAAAGHAASPAPPRTTRGNDSGGGGKQLDFGVGLGAGLVSGAISGILAGDVMMSEAAAYNYGYRAGLADGGAGATVYKKNSQYGVPEGKVEPNRTINGVTR